jgi:hypothetical protein
MTEIEALVRRKDKLLNEAVQIEGWRREARLSKRLGLLYDPRPWFGFLSGRGGMEAIVPSVVQAEFYEFLTKRLDLRNSQIREIEAQLADASRAVTDA